MASHHSGNGSERLEVYADEIETDPGIRDRVTMRAVMSQVSRMTGAVDALAEGVAEMRESSRVLATSVSGLRRLVIWSATGFGAAILLAVALYWTRT
jgi:hypothetical protein